MYKQEASLFHNDKETNIMTTAAKLLSHLSQIHIGVCRPLVWLVILVPIMISGCSIGDKIDKATDKVSDIAGDTVASLDGAIDRKSVV